MDKMSFHGAPRGRQQDFAESLFVLYDSLVELALMIRDLQFEVDTVKREQASVEVDRIVRRIRETTIGSPTIGYRDPTRVTRHCNHMHRQSPNDES